MLVKKENEDLIGRLSNWKFESAKRYLEGEHGKVKGIVLCLADMFGDVGWFDGSMHVIVRATVELLIGVEED